MKTDIRFVLYENDNEIINTLLTKMQPFTLDKEIIEENGDAGTIITVVFTVLQTALAVPGFILAMHEIISFLKSKELNKLNTKDVDNDEYIKKELSSDRWVIIINGQEYDLTSIVSEEERLKVLDRILQEHLKNG